MVNKNYQSGRRFEYKVKKMYEKAGYTVLRTSGSHGFADLIAVKQDIKICDRIIVFIQCKNRKATKQEREKLKKYAWLIHATPYIFTTVRMVDPETIKDRVI